MPGHYGKCLQALSYNFKREIAACGDHGFKDLYSLFLLLYYLFAVGFKQILKNWGGKNNCFISTMLQKYASYSDWIVIQLSVWCRISSTSRLADLVKTKAKSLEIAGI